jgi:GH15 family glucan-1,4-alpha-glucosidase
VEASFAPRDAFVSDLRLESRDGGIVARFLGRRQPASLGLWSSHALHVDPFRTSAMARFVLRSGDTLWMILAADAPPDEWSVSKAEDLLAATLSYWRGWIKRFEPLALSPASRRSLVTTHLLAYAPSGAMVAAPTAGLPERIGGGRNYDYRFAWIRDASLSVTSLCLLGDTETAQRYLRWLSGLGSSTRSPLQVLYDVHGRREGRLRPMRMRRADGYRGSRPLVFGNGAYAQRQLGSFGYVAECMATAIEHGMLWRPEYSALLGRLADHVACTWRAPDSGIWELQRHQEFLSSKVMGWVVLDRAAKIAARVGGFGPARVRRWQTVAAAVKAEVLARGYSERLGAFRQRYGADTLDASALLVPLTGFLPPEDPRVLSTLDRIDETLGLEGFVYRFEADRSEGEDPLPLGQFEGAFLPCTFWMVAARAMAGQIERAEDMLERAERRAGDLGLFAEELDPRTGEFLGNFPLLFSHVEHLRAVVAIERAKRSRRSRAVAHPAIGP